MNSPSSNQVYLLNTPILTDYGDWRFEGPLSVEQVQQTLAGGFVSAVGHAGGAEFLERLLGLPVPLNRVPIKMQPGDRAVVLRLTARLPEGAVLTEEQMQSLPYELGLLTRVA
jgi:hypothetical protein